MSSNDVAYYVALFSGGVLIGCLSRSAVVAIIGAIAWASLVFLVTRAAA